MSEATTEFVREEVLENGGIVKKVIREGEGDKTPPDRADVSVHYVGKLLDGTKFDSSRDRDDPFVFKIGGRQVIRGWDLGVATMKKGEIALLVCKPEYAYGEQGSPPRIPPNATLEFEVELLDWSTMQNVTEDGLVRKEILEAGTGYNRVNDDGKVRVVYDGYIAGDMETKIDTTNGEVREIDLVSEFTIMRGLFESFKNMLEGEKARCYISSPYGYGKAGNSDLGVPPGANLVYDVQLVSFEKGKETWDMSTEEKMQFAKLRKDQGNKLFQLGRIAEAVDRYDRASSVFVYDKDLTDEQKAEANQLKVTVHSNLAMCYLKRRQFPKVIDEAKKALDLDPSNVKALYRRARAYAETKEDEPAASDLRRALEIDPHNAPAHTLLQAVQKRIAKVEQKQRRLFGGFFNKVELTSAETQDAKTAPETKTASDAHAGKKRPAPGPATKENTDPVSADDNHNEAVAKAANADAAVAAGAGAGADVDLKVAAGDDATAAGDADDDADSGAAKRAKTSAPSPTASDVSSVASTASSASARRKYSRMRVAQLRTVLKRRGLSTSGTKKEMVERLMQ